MLYCVCFPDTQKKHRLYGVCYPDNKKQHRFYFVYHPDEQQCIGVIVFAIRIITNTYVLLRLLCGCERMFYCVCHPDKQTKHKIYCVSNPDGQKSICCIACAIRIKYQDMRDRRGPNPKSVVQGEWNKTQVRNPECKLCLANMCIYRCIYIYIYIYI